MHFSPKSIRQKVVLFLFFFSTIHKISYSTEIQEVLSYAFLNNPEIKLEKIRLQKEKILKNDVISNFLPAVQMSYQIGKRKNEVSNMDRGRLDEEQVQDIKEISLTQPIFNGFQNYNRLKETNYKIKAAEEYYKKQVNFILFSVIQAYLNLYKERRKLIFIKENLKHSKKILFLSRQRNELGELSGSELINYETEFYNNLSEELNIKRELFRAEKEYVKTVGKLDYNLGYPKLNSLPGENEDNILEKALSNNPDVKQAYFGITSGKYALKIAKGSFSPIIELSAVVEEQSNVVYLDDNDLTSKSVFLNFSIPLFQKGCEYTQIKKARLNLKFAQREYVIIRENLIKEVKQSFKEYIFFKDIIKSNVNLVSLNQDRVLKAEERLKLGEGDILDLLKVKIKFNDMKKFEMERRVDFALSHYKILTLLDMLRAL